MPVPSNQIKVTFINLLLFYPSTWYICDFFLFHIEIEGKGGWIIGGGGGRGGGAKGRLRTNYSSLNLDLFIKSISDSPLCQCGSVENAQHYFFHCRKYQVQRTELMNIVSQYLTPSLSILLYGNNSLSYEINTIIFEKVHKFILDSRRF